jgi:hypothetical protein
MVKLRTAIAIKLGDLAVKDDVVAESAELVSERRKRFIGVSFARY